MNAVLLQLQKPHTTMTEHKFLDVTESLLEFEISERELHNDTEFWNLPMLIAYFGSLFEQQQFDSSEDSFRDIQSMME